MSRFISAVAAAVAAVGTLGIATAPTRAVIVQYSTSGDTETVAMSNGLDATVTLDVYSDSVDLTPGVAQTLMLNGGDVDLFQGSNATGFDTLMQTLTVQGGGQESISQGVSILTTIGSPPFEPASADISIFAGAPAVFELGGGAYELTVTPLGGSRNGQTSTSIPISNNAEFLLTVVPEPATGLFALVGGAVALITRRRRA